MGFWEHMNEELKKAAEEGWTVVKDSARIGKLRYRVRALNRQAGKLFSDIGAIVYEMRDSKTQNPLLSPEVRSIINEIQKIEQESELLEREIDETRKKGPVTSRPLKK